MTHLTATLLEFEKFTKKKNLVLNNSRLLDVGCRDNSNKSFFKQLKIEWEGIDIMPRHEDVKQMSMTNLSKLQTNHYDFVFICHALEHCYSPFEALGEMKEILKDGGWLFLSLPCYCNFHLDEIDHLFCFTQKQIDKILKFIQYVDVDVYKGTTGGYDDKKLYNLICVGKKDTNTNMEVFRTEYTMYPTSKPKETTWDPNLNFDFLNFNFEK